MTYEWKIISIYYIGKMNSQSENLILQFYIPI